MAKFKIGDRVRNIGYILNGLEIGDTGTISGVCDEGGWKDYAVRFDKRNTRLHDCGGMTDLYHGLFLTESSLELINDEQPEREFKVIITSKGDATTAKLMHGKEVEREAKVTRYHKDKYNEQAAIEAVVKKLFGEEQEKENPVTYYNGRVICIRDNSNKNMTLLPRFTKGKIYVITNGRMINEFGHLVNDITSVKQLNKRFGKSFEFVEIKE